MRWWSSDHWRQRPLLDYRKPPERFYRKVWEKNGRTGGLPTGRGAKAHCLPRRGTIIFHRCHAHCRRWRGLQPPLRLPSSRYAGAGPEQARSSGPQGIHVAHPIIDGGDRYTLYRIPFPSAMH